MPFSAPGVVPIYRNRYGQSIAELMMRQGEPMARAAEIRGQLWSNAISQVGQIAAQAVQQHQEAKRQKDREAIFDQALSSWDPANPGAFYRATAVAYGPEMATSALRAMAAVEESRRVQAPDPKLFAPKAEFLKRMKDTNPDWLRKNWAGVAQMVGPDVKALYGLDIGPEWQEEYGQALDSMVPATEDTKPMVVSGRLVRPTKTGSEVLYEPPPEAPKAEKTTLEQLYAQAFAAGDQAKMAEIRGAMAQEAAATRAPKEAGEQRPLTQTSEAEIINRLSRQFTAAAKPFRDIKRQSDLMETGLDAARRGDLAAGSQAVLVTFQKILDPTSVVRESEYARSAAGQSLISRIRGAADRLARGGAGVPVNELEKFARLAKEFTSGYEKSIQPTIERIKKTADRYNIPHELVLEEIQVAPPAEGSTLPRPATPQDAAKLPSGTRFIGPDGRVRTRK